MKKYCILCLLLFVFIINGFSSDIYALIKSGRIDEASELLSEVSTASTRNGDKLFFLSLIEKDAARSAQLMEAALNASVSMSYRQEIYFKLAQYYYLNNNIKKLNYILNDYNLKWRTGKYHRQMARFSILIAEKRKAYDMSLRQVDRYLLDYTRNDEKQWGLLDKARIMKKYNKPVGAQKLLRKLSKEKSGCGVPQALYLLALKAIEKSRTDDAVFYYNLLREAYPQAIGLNAIIEEMGNLSSSSDRDSKAEKITGTYYSIQIGVFSKKGNAKNQASRFKHYDKKVEIKNKTIANVKYHVIYIGRFNSYEAAARFKQILEAEHNEVFQVVAR